MKKLFFSTLLLLVLASTKTNAQVKDNLSLGPIFGFGHTTISGEIEEEAKKKFNPSLNVGLRLMYSNHPQWGFGADLSFRTEGAKIGSTTTNEEVRLNTSYIRIDPKAYYFFADQGKAFRPKIGIGPSLGFLASGKFKFYEGSNLIEEMSADEFLKNIDLGIAGSLGFNYRIKSSMWLNVDVSYTHGLLNIVKEADEEAIRNRSLFLNVGVLFGIGSAKK